MKKAKVIIGSAYGDEGKGVFTDYFSSQEEESMVIRFNGGAQAGHTVLTPEGKRHVFGHFCSNSFLPNAKTVLSKFFIVNPLLFHKEKLKLNSYNINPKVYIDENCYVTTPFEMLINQWLENSRGNNRHGSCGVGFGETIEREEVEKISLRMKDIFSLNLLEKLEKIKDYFIKRIKTLNLTDVLIKNNFCLDPSFIEKFAEDFTRMKYEVELFSINVPESKNIIFEGAQGLLLDQSMGYFPYVTRSNTGIKNVIELSKDFNISILNVLYASRCYTTRHGAGPLKNQLKQKPYENIVDNTNIQNEYQGSLKFAYLDINLLEKTIKKDIKSINSDLQISFNLGITCLDQTKEIKFYEKSKINKIKNEDFTKYLQNKFNVNVLGGWKGSRDYIFNN